ncbi:MAG: HIT family protein [Promethearchaeota archaeon]|nr:MAG: HIT family protein [Candidatus Lokiarchaeota archaeon]
MNEKECLFCNITTNEIPAKIIFNDEICIGILDIFPISKGHTLVIPKSHYSTIEDIPDDILTHLMVVVKKLGKKIHNRLNIDGYNILQNNFTAAGQVINHFHIHIIPRKKDDAKFQIKIPKLQIDDSTLDAIKSEILS